jgi:hypothetical protein
MNDHKLEDQIYETFMSLVIYLGVFIVPISVICFVVFSIGSPISFIKLFFHL